MQRLFSSFASGWPGTGLLLMRVVVGIAVIDCGVVRLWGDPATILLSVLSVLEIGAGTGSSTIPILEVLGGHRGYPARFSSYTFTDISAGFFDKAGEILKDWEPYLTYHKLDIEQDPTNQGFEAESYDIVIANNVLHATHSIQQTLANAKRLLKP